MVTENVELAVEAESAPELVPLPVTVTVYTPALDAGGAEGPDPHPSIASSNPNEAMPSVTRHFRRHSLIGSKPNPHHSAQAMPIPGGSNGRAAEARAAVEAMVTVAVAVPFAASVELAGLMAQVGGKAAAPLEMLQLRATLPTKPEVDVRPIESLLPVVAPEAKLMEEDAGDRVNDGGVAVTITCTEDELEAL
jgi:hypothetical protein